jgi:hypothetical protein
MPAAIKLKVYTGTNAATESDDKVSVTLLSSGSSFSNSATRNANPVTVGTTSFVRYVRLKLATAPVVSVSNFKWWVDTAPMSGVALRVKEAQGNGGVSPGTGLATPSSAALTGDIDAYTRTPSSPGTWDSAPYSTAGHVTKALAFQLQPPTGPTASFNWTATVNFSYDES